MAHFWLWLKSPPLQDSGMHVGASWLARKTWDGQTTWISTGKHWRENPWPEILEPCREEHSMDQWRWRQGISERFGSHWSIWIFRESCGDQSLGASLSGKICVDQWPWEFVKSFPRDWHWSMDHSFQPWEHTPKILGKKKPNFRDGHLADP